MITKKTFLKRLLNKKLQIQKSNSKQNTFKIYVHNDKTQKSFYQIKEIIIKPKIVLDLLKILEERITI